MTGISPKRELATILVIVFLGFLGISMPYLIFPALFLNPDYSILPPTWSPSSQAIGLGITLAAYPLGQFIGSPILGALSDDYGRKRLLTGSLVVTAFSTLLTGLAIEWQQLGLIIGSRFAAGLMEGNIAIARAMAAHIKSISKHEAFGKINAVTSIAYLIGPLFGGLLSDNNLFEDVTTATPFYLVGFLFLGIAVLSALILQPDRMADLKKEARSIASRLNLVHRLSTLFKNRPLRFLMIVSTLFTLAIDIFFEFAPVYLTAKWVLGPAQLTVYNSVLCVGLAVGNGWFASYFAKHYSSRPGILGATGGLALLLISIVLADHASWMMALFTLIGLTIGLGVTLITVKISNAADDTIQGEVMGVQLSLRVLGDAVICLLGGVLLLLSSKLILVLAAFISVASMFYYKVNFSESK